MNGEDLKARVFGKLEATHQAAPLLARLSTDEKNRALESMADALLRQQYAILAANQGDVEAMRDSGETGARLERLTLTLDRIQDMVSGLRQVVNLPDPIGEIMESFERGNGLQISKVRVPMGVIAVIYESRPNVTVDSAALALKTGNAVVLRGGKEAMASNLALVAALQEGLFNVGLPKEAISYVDEPSRESVDLILGADKLVDLAIPRGGAGLIAKVKEISRVPVIETGVGNCHVYVHEAANLDMATRIVLNAKTQRPSVCNAMETLLVDEAVLRNHPEWFTSLAEALLQRRVELRLDQQSFELAAEQPSAPSDLIRHATEADYESEFLSLILAVKAVRGLADALSHIAKYGTKHSEAIVTDDAKVAEEFLLAVDAAAVYHNASTRFTDGSEFGFGAEIGISTQKLHARGPMGLRELCSYKYIVRGEGQIRE